MNIHWHLYPVKYVYNSWIASIFTYWLDVFINSTKKHKTIPAGSYHQSIFPQLSHNGFWEAYKHGHENDCYLLLLLLSDTSDMLLVLQETEYSYKAQYPFNTHNSD